MVLKKNFELKNLTNYKIGGRADYFSEVTSEEELKAAIEEFNLNGGGSIFILGGGTNVLISDDGFRGLVLKPSFNSIQQEGYKIKVGSGVLIKDLLEYCVKNELSGLEWAGGLPGNMGGAVRGNAGAFGGEIKDSVLDVKSFNMETGQVAVRDVADCDFDYRNSYYKKNQREIILKVGLLLKPGKREILEATINEKIQYRQRRHPLEYPNAGSIFKNIPYDSLPQKLKDLFQGFIKYDPFPVIPVVKILLQTDIWEKRIGDARFSDKHPNFIVNLGNAKASDIKTLIEMAKEAVKEKFGIQLEEEIMYVGNFNS